MIILNESNSKNNIIFLDYINLKDKGKRPLNTRQSKT